jgi:hypothetical protein
VLAGLLIRSIFYIVLSHASALLDGPPNVAQHGCDHLDMTEIRRLIALELNQIDDSRPYQITLTCEGDTLRMAVQRDRTQQVLERSIELGETHLRERIVALTVSQLVIAETPPPVETATPPLPSSSTVPQDSRTPAIPRAEEDTVDHVALSLGGGIKPHGMFSLPTGYWLVRSDIWFSTRLGLISMLSLEGGRAKRSLGSVKALSGLAGLGVALRVLTSRRLHLELSGSASIGYTQLGGKPHQEAGGAELGGVAGEFVIGMGGVATIKDVLLALDLLGGYTVKNPEGFVDQDTSVSLAGFWIGGGLRIGLLKR